MAVMREVRCTKPGCKSLIVREARPGVWKLSARTTVFDDKGRCRFAVCRHCGTEVPVPLSFDSPVEPLDKGVIGVRVKGPSRRVVVLLDD